MDSAHDLQAIQPWHAQVDNGDLRPMRQRLFDSLGAIGGFGDDQEFVLIVQQSFQAVANDGVIVGQKNANGFHGAAVVCSGMGARSSVAPIDVPRPSAELITMSPPNSAIRSCMPIRPTPRSV